MQRPVVVKIDWIYGLNIDPETILVFTMKDEDGLVAVTKMPTPILFEVKVLSVLVL